MIGGVYEKLFAPFGMNLIGASFSMNNVPESVPFLAKRVLEEGAERLYIQLYQMFPEDVCDEIQERLSFGKNYGMGCVCRGGLFGNITIRLKRGAELRNRETIEAFVRQAAVALQRRYIQEKLKGAEERLMEGR